MQVKIITGKWQGKTGPVFARTPSYFFDVNILSGGTFELPIPGDWNSLIFLHSGEVLYQEKTLAQINNICVLDKKNSNDEILHKFRS